PGQQLAFNISGSEISNRPVTLSATNLPSGANFRDNGDNTGTFTWTPEAAQAGTYSVPFHAANTLGDGETAITLVKLSPPNDAFPEAPPIPALPYTNNVVTTAATTASDDPFAGLSRSRTVWYSLVLDQPARIVADCAGSDFQWD